MRWQQVIQSGVSHLFASKLRTTLALLGVLVGTASVVAMVLGGELATREALRQFKSLGTDLLAVSLSMNSEEAANRVNGKEVGLTLEDANQLGNLSDDINRVAPYTQLFFPVTFPGVELNAPLLGVTSDFFAVMKLTVSSGRKITLADHYEYYCVIGASLAQTIQSTTHRNPVGDFIEVGKQWFQIVGVASPWQENSFVYANLDESILIPLETALTMSQFASINNIVIRLKQNADTTNIQQSIENYIQKAVPELTVHFRNAKELIEKMKKQNDIFTIFLGLIGSVSLIVGGIGVMNILLVSVIERKREIGIRLAIGAKPNDIAILFLMESLIISLLGGITGVLFGITIAYGIALFSHWEFILFMWPCFMGLIVSVVVGLVSGAYPAYLASRMNPIDALRSV